MKNAHLIEFVNNVVQRVAEIPDRNSPDDDPEMMLVTQDELTNILRDELADLKDAELRSAVKRLKRYGEKQ